MQILLVTAPQTAASDLARSVVEEKLAACVNIVEKVRSIYHWNDRIEDESEAMLFIKTTNSGAQRLRERIIELHPYEVPEILCLVPDDAQSNPAYLSWIKRSVST